MGAPFSKHNSLLNRDYGMAESRLPQIKAPDLFPESQPKDVILIDSLPSPGKQDSIKKLFTR
jgi:hypothetical protein